MYIYSNPTMINIGEDILLIIILYFILSLCNGKEYIDMVWHYASTVKVGHFEWITM